MGGGGGGGGLSSVMGGGGGGGALLCYGEGSPLLLGGGLSSVMGGGLSSVMGRALLCYGGGLSSVIGGGGSPLLWGGGSPLLWGGGGLSSDMGGGGGGWYLFSCYLIMCGLDQSQDGGISLPFARDIGSSLGLGHQQALKISCRNCRYYLSSASDIYSCARLRTINLGLFHPESHIPELTLN